MVATARSYHMGNYWNEDRAERTRQEMEAGAARVSKNMIEGLCEQLAKDYKLPKPVLNCPNHYDRSGWTITVTLPGDVVHTENWNEFPSDILRTTLMLLGHL